MIGRLIEWATYAALDICESVCAALDCWGDDE